MLREVGRVVAPLPALATLCLGAQPIARFGSSEQRARYLAGVSAGELILTGAFDGPPGEAPGLVVAHPDGSGWTLSGACAAVPAAHLAARVLVPTAHGDGVTVFLVDPKAPGVSSTRNRNTRGEPQFDLAFDSVSVGPGDRLGEPDQGRDIVAWARRRGVLGVCAQQVGVLEGAVALTAEYVTNRQQFGRAIGSFQAVSQRVADAYIDLEATRLTMWQAASALQSGGEADVELAVAKYWAATAGHRIVHTAQHLHGGIGVDTDYPLHRYFLWAKHHEVLFGTGSPWLEHLGAILADTDPEW